MPRKRLAILASLAALATASGLLCVTAAREKPEILCTKLEAPIDIEIRPLQLQPAQGRYLVEVRTALRAPLNSPRMLVHLPEGARLSQGSKDQRLGLKQGQPQLQTLAIDTSPGEGLTLVVGVRGTLDGAVLGKAASLDLGPVRHPQLQGKVRTDRQGTSYFEVPMAAPATEEAP